MLFTAQRFVENCPGNTLPEKFVYFGNWLDTQTQQLQEVTAKVIIGPERQNTLSPAATKSHNKKLLNKFKILQQFFHDHLSSPDDFNNNIVHSDTSVLFPEEIECDVQVFNTQVIVLQQEHLNASRWVQNYKNISVYFLMKMLQLASTPRYINDQNGLQKLLVDMSICNIKTEGAEVIPLSGEEAFRQKKTISHLHHLPRAFDINPYNNTPEGAYENNARKRCSITPWKKCQCNPNQPCHPRIGPVNMSQDLYADQVKVGLCTQFGDCPGMGERDIRIFLRNQFIACLRRNGVTSEDDERFLDYLKSDNEEALLETRYDDTYGRIRTTHDFSNPGLPGVLPRTEDNPEGKCTFAQWVKDPSLSLANVPRSFLQYLESQTKTVTRSPTIEISSLDEYDRLCNRSIEAISSEINQENTFTTKRFAAALSFLRLDPPNIEKGLGNEEETACGALLHSVNNLTYNAQHAKFEYCLSTEELRGRICPNDFAYNNCTGSSRRVYQPTLPRLTHQIAFMWDYWVEFGGSLQAINDYLSIRGMPTDDVEGVERISSRYALIQKLEASHLCHVSLLDTDEMAAARDMNPDNMTYDNKGENNGRKICALRPLIPCLHQCKCHGDAPGRRKCKVVLHKLTEKNWDQECEIQYCLGPFGLHPDLTSKNGIRLHYLGKYREAYTLNLEDEPRWIGVRRGIYQADPDGNTNPLFKCQDCGKSHFLYTKFEECCEEVNVEQEQEPEEAEEEEFVELSNITDCTKEDILRVCDAITEVGVAQNATTRKWKAVRDKFTELHRQERSQPGYANPNEPIRKLCIEEMDRKFLGRAKFKNATKERGIDDYRTKLLNCTGRMNRCGTHRGCTLHPDTTNN